MLTVILCGWECLQPCLGGGLVTEGQLGETSRPVFASVSCYATLVLQLNTTYCESTHPERLHRPSVQPRPLS